MALDEEEKVQATVTVNNILNHVHDNNGSNLTDISDELDIAKSTTYRHVNTLVDLGFLIKEDQIYLPGFKMFKYASAAKANFPIIDIATEELERVFEISNEQVTLHFKRNERLYEVFRIGDQEQTHLIEESTEALFQSAPGQCLIAYSDWEDVLSLPRVNEEACDLEKLREELRQIRREEVAIERDQDQGFARVAVPICINGSTVASICVTGPVSRLSGKRLTQDIPGLLQNTAKIIEIQLLSA